MVSSEEGGYMKDGQNEVLRLKLRDEDCQIYLEHEYIFDDDAILYHYKASFYNPDNNVIWEQEEDVIPRLVAEKLYVSLALYLGLGHWLLMSGFKETFPWSIGYDRDLHTPATTAEVADVISHLTMTAVAAADQRIKSQPGELSPSGLPSARIPVDTLRRTFQLKIQWAIQLRYLSRSPLFS
ncbi:hypothetical protein COCMIDRAFT_28959 [Bipolaris oryzae ATCC 44560]|uniref:Uncharacterized protein n=1 Tax=Bipolaris oryzae ATCC 44560 TaxID=930090 RepID=W6Z460_COCMI|nr:uncharacterized protein COCMIDRAFT_28959 [Bipolaris oryzae ATCC 44560]EUC42419.1 hypothetical protein COCMIDRAFT_28959 [Bipolaris oryzae ATCC 44560]